MGPLSKPAPLVSWPIVREDCDQAIPGRAISAFINNGSCHFSPTNVFADGLIECWEFVDIPILRMKVHKRWIVPFPLPRQEISIFNLGFGLPTDAEWWQTPESIISQVESTLRDLNPNSADWLDMKGKAKF